MTDLKKKVSQLLSQEVLQLLVVISQSAGLNLKENIESDHNIWVVIHLQSASEIGVPLQHELVCKCDKKIYF